MAKRWTLVLGGSLLLLGLMAITLAWLEQRDTIDTSGAPHTWGGARGGPAPPEDMVLLPGGEYVVGDDWPEASADAPLRSVRVSAFYIDRHEVTNRQFARFVSATGHMTTAEREGGGWIYRAGERDWKYVRGADWRHPLGPGSSIDEALDHPVVLVSWEDAAAYAVWAGKRLPTEAEWEIAARGARSAGTQPRIADLRTASLAADVQHDQHHEHANPAEDGSANVWQGQWPQRNHLKDGFFYTAPVGSFRPNPLGIYDMIGNVWEWTADWYDEDYYVSGPEENPRGPADGTLRVARGGSWFCSSNYCGAYRPGFRGKSPPTNGFNNVGFRCARDAQPPSPE